MNDYERVARIINYVSDNYKEQPSLSALADVAGLSSYHFHRLFKRWAQTTPKSFVQHLTAIEAGRLLRAGSPVLDTALELGLSGPSRLHDLCVTIEAATPGEIRSGGEGLDITAGFSVTPFGEALLAYGSRGICKLSFVKSPQEKAREIEMLSQLWPNAQLSYDDQAATILAKSIFNNKPTDGKKTPLQLYVKGTAFQEKVWKALIEIPCGESCCYSDIAEKIGQPRSQRAVGSAVGKNPIAFIIPCHRVLQSSGAVGGYHWGVDRKKAILTWEQSCGDISFTND